MARRLNVVLCALVWVFLGLGISTTHAQEPVPTSDTQAQASDSANAKDAIRPACQDADDAFASHFDLYLLAFATFFLVILPLALPLFGVRIWWILAHPYHRWVFVTLIGLGLFLLLIYAPALAVAFMGLPPTYAPVLAGVDHVYPAQCAGTGIATSGFLWSTISSGRELSILSVPKMTLAAVAAFSVAAVLYWGLFLLLRRIRPLQPAR